MTSINLAPEKVETIVLASCLLHNYLRSNPSSSAIYTPPGSLDSEHPLSHEVQHGIWRNEITSNNFKSLERQGSNHSSENSKLFRNYMMDYFNSEAGAVSWQNAMI